MQPPSAPPTLEEVSKVSSVEEAIAIQAKVEPLVRIPVDDSDVGQIHPETLDILALDVAYSTRSDLIVASGALYRLSIDDLDKDLKLQDCVIAEKVLIGIASFSYIPGLLAFREIPILSKIIEELIPLTLASDASAKKKTTVLLCDGAGIAHPRLCGLASHLGVLYGLPSIGVAKNHLIGTSTSQRDAEKAYPALGDSRGSYTPLFVKEKEVGSVLRSQDGVRPIYVSPGYLISTKGARELVLKLCEKYRLPEPIRRADHIGRLELKRLEAVKLEGKEEEVSKSSFVHRQ